MMVSILREIPPLQVLAYFFGTFNAVCVLGSVGYAFAFLFNRMPVWVRVMAILMGIISIEYITIRVVLLVQGI